MAAIDHDPPRRTTALQNATFRYRDNGQKSRILDEGDEIDVYREDDADPESFSDVAVVDTPKLLGTMKRREYV